MDENASSSVLKSLELDAAQVESLSETDLCALIGFLDYDARLQARQEADDEFAAQAWTSSPRSADGHRQA